MFRVCVTPIKIKCVVHLRISPNIPALVYTDYEPNFLIEFAVFSSPLCYTSVSATTVTSGINFNTELQRTRRLTEFLPNLCVSHFGIEILRANKNLQISQRCARRVPLWPSCPQFFNNQVFRLNRTVRTEPRTPHLEP